MDIRLPKLIEDFMAIITAAGHDAYAVGGCVRDSLLGNTPHDWDVCSGALPEEIKEVFSDHRIIETGIRHGTVTVRFRDKNIEVTTFRTEGEYSDFRHPDSVTFTRSLQEDLSRRDFTVNAMAYSPSEGLVDPFGGVKDLENNVIRCVGDPDRRFREDALRILRALRFASVLGFTIDRDTGRAMRKNASLLNRIAVERIAAELKGILCGDNIKEVLTEYADVIFTVIPELAPMSGCVQNNPYHIYTVWEHTAVSVTHIKNDPVLRLTMLFHDSGKPACKTTDENGVDHFHGHADESVRIAENVLKRLRFDNKTVERVKILVKHHDDRLTDPDRQIRRMMNSLSTDVFFQLLDVYEADIAAQSPKYMYRLEELDAVRETASKIVDEKSCVTLGGLAVNGDDLILHGIAEGREVGRALKFLLGAVLDGDCNNDRDSLIRYLDKFFK